MPWIGLQFVIVVFPDHSHLLLDFNLFLHKHVCNGVHGKRLNQKLHEGLDGV